MCLQIAASSNMIGRIEYEAKKKWNAPAHRFEIDINLKSDLAAYVKEDISQLLTWTDPRWLKYTITSPSWLDDTTVNWNTLRTAHPGICVLDEVLLPSPSTCERHRFRTAIYPNTKLQSIFTTLR